ncbi:MAG: amidohydrolase family protein [Myxococcales bacterium]|nr:amidohydrolase family protein [Myxococcales bacterium]
MSARARRAALALSLVLALDAAGCHRTERAGQTAPQAEGGQTGGAIVVRGLSLIDGTGAPPIENGALVIVGETLRAAGRGASIPIPEGARVVDLHGKTVIPGLVSDHSHLGMVDGVGVGAGHATRENMLRQLRQFEVYGVTSITSLGFNGALFYALQGPLHRGELPGADLFGADRGLGVIHAAPPVDPGPDRLYRVATPDEARAAVRETASRHPDLVKIWVDDFKGTLEPRMSPEVYRAIIDEAHRSYLRVAAHVFYLEDAKRLVDDGVDVLAHGVRDQPVDDQLVAAMRAHATWYIPTIGLDESSYVYAEAPPWTRTPFFRHALQPALAAQLADPQWRGKMLGDEKKVALDKDAVAMNLRNLKALHDAGVAIGFGTDSGATPLCIPGFAEHRELALMVQAGIAPLEALHIATSEAARLLGLADRGELRPGKLADFVVVDGDPSRSIDDLSRVVEVWHRGRRVSGSVEEFTP